MQTQWLALIALTATACQTDPPQTSTPTAQTVAATPIVPATTVDVASTRALPIMPASEANTAPVKDAVGPSATSRADQVKALQDEYGQARKVYFDLFRQAKSDEERQQIALTTLAPDPAPYCARARAIVEADATDAAAFDALSFLIAQGAQAGEDAGTDIALLERYHFESERMLEALSMLQYSDSAAGKALLARLAQASPHRNVRGRALLAQAEALKEELATSVSIASLTDGEEREQYVGFVGQADFDRLLALDRVQAEADILAIYETVVRDYADVPTSRKGVIGDQAKASIHEMKNLVVGKTAPNIAGEDIHGVEFQLADYRGKVVLLDFWGHW